MDITNELGPPPQVDATQDSKPIPGALCHSCGQELNSISFDSNLLAYYCLNVSCKNAGNLTRALKLPERRR